MWTLIHQLCLKKKRPRLGTCLGWCWLALSDTNRSLSHLDNSLVIGRPSKMTWGICPSGPPTFYIEPLKIHQDTHTIQPLNLQCLTLYSIDKGQILSAMQASKCGGARMTPFAPFARTCYFFSSLFCSFLHWEKTQKEQTEKARLSSESQLLQQERRWPFVKARSHL